MTPFEVELLRLGGIWAKCGILPGMLVYLRQFVLGKEIILVYLSISACAIEVQHNNENSSTIPSQSSSANQMKRKLGIKFGIKFGIKRELKRTD